MAYGISDLRIGEGFAVALIGVCGVGAAVLHWIGRYLLGRLRE
jgi:hypothetical protein